MHRPPRVRPLLAASLLAVALASCGRSSTAPRPVEHSLPAVLSRTLTRHHLPAIAGAVVRGDSIAGIAALGVRKRGASDSVTVAGHYHLGSNVKAMTADLLGVEVEAGRLAWDRTLAQVFPEFADSVRAEYRGVTPGALLQHRSGLPAFTDPAELTTVPDFTGTLEERRQAAARWLLRQPPGGVAGNAYLSVGDYARFARLHLRAMRGHPELLTAATFQRLHAVKGSYAMGWEVQPLGGTTTWFHAGSAGTFGAIVMIQPARDAAVVVLTNAGSNEAIFAAQDAAIQLLAH